MKLNQILEQFLADKYVKNSRSENTIRSYKKTIVAIFDHFKIEDISDLAKLNFSDISSWQNMRMMQVSARTVNQQMMALKSFAKYLKLCGLVGDEFINILTPPKFQSKQKRIGTIDEYRTLINSFKGNKRDYTLFNLYASSGARYEGIATLTIDNVRPNGIYITEKGNKERFVPIQEEIMTLVMDYIQNDRKSPTMLSEIEFNGNAKNWKGKYSDYVARYNLARNFVFVTRTGLQLDNMTLNAKLKTAATKVNVLKGCDNTLHSIRHSYAQSCLRANMPITALQSNMGHTNVATTSIYARYSDSQRETMVAMTPKFI